MVVLPVVVLVMLVVVVVVVVVVSWRFLWAAGTGAWARRTEAGPRGDREGRWRGRRMSKPSPCTAQSSGLSGMASWH
jgi:hypothetical protein